VVEEEKPAPSFNLPSDTGETISLESLRGKPVVLYFYPKDDSLPHSSSTPDTTGGSCGV
jgi:peroxiredoxin Q/BCP